MIHREVRVLIAVHDQQRDGRDPRGGLIGRHGDGVPLLGADPRLHQHLGRQAADAMLHGEVHAAHPFGPPVVPVAGAAHRNGRVEAADQPGVPDDDRRAHGESDGRDPLVAQLPRVADGDVKIADLAVAHGGQATGTPVPAEVEAHDARDPVESGRDAPHRGPLPGQREAVREHDGKVAFLREMHGVDRDAIVGYQGLCRRHGGSHISHCAVPARPWPTWGRRDGNNPGTSGR